MTTHTMEMSTVSGMRKKYGQLALVCTDLNSIPDQISKLDILL
ncbi:hypothetical protein DYBT9275_05311 [Dyadobacter sp. CECT 9275]|uniref:Uncharacterized protein n=1 Tax=Dyadobacter helix TaxID=2822344 RepID=A0A916N774_9BACT|nr:hypothetical protein DYBT9275_05311 [Dyadobacter sp. CECT 9275]